jgi:hypothetical protein
MFLFPAHQVCSSKVDIASMSSKNVDFAVSTYLSALFVEKGTESNLPDRFLGD